MNIATQRIMIELRTAVKGDDKEAAKQLIKAAEERFRGDDEVYPFIEPLFKAVILIETHDLTILEKLWPEWRSIVVDIVLDLDPDYAEEIYKINPPIKRIRQELQK